MECNREEAVRALELAEAKLQRRDVEGARRLVQKARRLFPSLARITQTCALIDVLSAAPTAGGEPDWYAVLGVDEPSAPISLIRKQYHALALLLHPDKNTSAHAGEGFKLVAQAWAVLSKASARASYDDRRSASSFGSNAGNAAPAPSYGFGGAVVMVKTRCSHCKKESEVGGEFLGCSVSCKYCRAFFLASEIKADGPASVDEDFGQKMAKEKTGSSSSAAKVAENVMQERTERENVDVKSAGIDESRSHGKNTRLNSDSRRKKVAVAMPTNSESRTKMECENIEGSTVPKGSACGDGHIQNDKPMENVAPVSGRKSDNQHMNSTENEVHVVPVSVKKRKSDNQRTNFTENEVPLVLPNEKVVDLDAEYKETSGNAVPPVPMKAKNNVREVSLDGASCSRQNAPARKRTRAQERVYYNESRLSKNCHHQSHAKITIPDADFYSFSAVVSEDFRGGQVWALYDDTDKMPRFYAYIECVLSRDPFRVRIQWLEAKTEQSQAVGDWIDAGFYLGCGEFQPGETQNVSSLDWFSHQILYWENTPDGNFRIMPGIGEFWALYKNWSATWSNSEKPGAVVHCYEMVEIAKDFDQDVGFEVIPLIKLKNYVSVFQRGRIKKRVRIDEMLRLSHAVPFKELAGDEDPNLPRNCVQLDPAAIT